MFQAVLDGLATFGPIVFLMLTPVLIPVVTVSVGAVTDRARARR